MQPVKIIKLFIAICFVVFFTGMSNIHSQSANTDEFADDTQPISDTIFNKISLSTEGVVARDTIGNNWFYDFNQEQFVAGDDKSEFSDIDSDPDDFLSVEERCTELRVIRSFEKRVTIREDEFVEGNIIAYGRVNIKGWVKGDVKSLNGRVLIASSGQVDGDITAPRIIIKEGGEVLGELEYTDIPFELDDIKKSFSVDGIIVVISLMMFFFFAGFLIMALMPNKLKTFNSCYNEKKVKTTLTGFMLILLMPVIVLLITITIVGIVIVPFVPFIYLLAIIMGAVAFSNQLGELIGTRLLHLKSNLYTNTFIGLVMITAGWLLTSILLGMSSEVSVGFGIFFLVIMIIISSYPICAGIGAAFITRFGFRSYENWANRQPKSFAPAAPAPPPIPNSLEANGHQPNQGSPNKLKNIPPDDQNDLPKDP